MLLLVLGCAHPGAPPPPADLGAPAPVAAPVDPVWARVRSDVEGSGTHAWDRLARLCDDIGARPSGSDAYLRATEWAEAELKGDGLTTARREPVTHSVWSRGEEHLTLLAPHRRELAVLGLGGTVGTPGLEASVVVVHDFDALSPAVAGHVVLFDVPMADTLPAVAQYAETVAYRTQGASRAAALGAVGVLVRSVTARSLYTPHTGAMRYADDAPKIPAAAITTEDAAQITRLAARGIEVRVRMELGARWLPDAAGANVVAEIPGTVHPEQIVLIAAHLDSWDVGTGAHDDGAGVVEVLEAMRALAGTQPRRTIRAVLYDNEEHGLSGGRAYADAHGHEVHTVAMETDLGGGRPLAWAVSGTPEQSAVLGATLAPLGLPIEGDGGGADISPLEAAGVPLVGLRPDDSHYFDVHHTNADTVDKVDPDALRAGVVAVAGFAWLTANAP
jgi:carboxypeptidase Q